MDASAAEPTPSDSQEAFVGNPLALGAADDTPGQGLGDGESVKAADDVPPASELLPKLHLALKMAGHGNWPGSLGWASAISRSSTRASVPTLHAALSYGTSFCRPRVA